MADRGRGGEGGGGAASPYGTCVGKEGGRTCGKPLTKKNQTGYCSKHRFQHSAAYFRSRPASGFPIPPEVAQQLARAASQPMPPPAPFFPPWPPGPAPPSAAAPLSTPLPLCSSASSLPTTAMPQAAASSSSSHYIAHASASPPSSSSSSGAPSAGWAGQADGGLSMAGSAGSGSAGASAEGGRSSGSGGRRLSSAAAAMHMPVGQGEEEDEDDVMEQQPWGGGTRPAKALRMDPEPSLASPPLAWEEEEEHQPPIGVELARFMPLLPPTPSSSSPSVAAVQCRANMAEGLREARFIVGRKGMEGLERGVKAHMHELSITFTRQGGQVVQVAVALQSFAETKDIKAYMTTKLDNNDVKAAALRKMIVVFAFPTPVPGGIRYNAPMVDRESMLEKLRGALAEVIQDDEEGQQPPVVQEVLRLVRRRAPDPDERVIVIETPWPQDPFLMLAAESSAIYPDCLWAAVAEVSEPLHEDAHRPPRARRPLVYFPGPVEPDNQEPRVRRMEFGPPLPPPSEIPLGFGVFERLRPGLKRENARGVPLPVVVRVDTRVNASDKGNYVLYNEASLDPGIVIHLKKVCMVVEQAYPDIRRRFGSWRSMRAAPMAGNYSVTIQFMLPFVNLAGASIGGSVAVAILSELLKKPLVPFFHVLCGVNLDGSLDVVEGVQEKLAGVVSYHTQTGTWNHPNMVPPAGGGFHENHFISVVVAAEQAAQTDDGNVLLSDLRTRRPVSLSEPADTRLRVFGLTSLTQLAELAFNPTPQGILQNDDAEPYARRLIRSVYAASWDGPTMQLHFCKLSAMFFDVPGRARSSIFGPESERGGAPLRLFVGNFPEEVREACVKLSRHALQDFTHPLRIDFVKKMLQYRQFISTYQQKAAVFQYERPRYPSESTDRPAVRASPEMELGVAVLEEAELLDVDRQLFENQQFFVCGHVVVRSNHFELSVDPSLRSALQDLNLRAAIMKPVFWEEGGRRPRIFAPLDMEVEEHAGLYTVTEVTRLYGDGGLFPNHLSPLLVSQYFLGPPPINDPRAYRIRCCELLFSRYIPVRGLWVGNSISFKAFDTATQKMVTVVVFRLDRNGDEMLDRWRLAYEALRHPDDGAWNHTAKVLRYGQAGVDNANLFYFDRSRRFVVLEEQGSNLEDLVWERGSHGFSSGKVVQLGRLLLRHAELVEERRVVLYGLGPEAVYTTSFTREGEGLQPDLGHLGGIKFIMSTDAHIPPPGQQHSTHRPLGYYMHNLPPEALLCFGAKQPQRMEVEGAVRWQMGLTLFFAARGRLFLRSRTAGGQTVSYHCLLAQLERRLLAEGQGFPDAFVLPLIGLGGCWTLFRAANGPYRIRPLLQLSAAERQIVNETVSLDEETFPDMNLNDEQLGRFRELLRGLLNIMPGDRTEPADALEELNAMMG